MILDGRPQALSTSYHQPLPALSGAASMRT